MAEATRASRIRAQIKCGSGSQLSLGGVATHRLRPCPPGLAGPAWSPGWGQSLRDGAAEGRQSHRLPSAGPWCWSEGGRIGRKG